MSCRVVPSSTFDQVEKNIDIDGGEEKKLNNNNIILDGSSRANELLNGLSRVDQMRDKEENDEVSLECISSRKPSVIVPPDTE